MLNLNEYEGDIASVLNPVGCAQQLEQGDSVREVQTPQAPRSGRRSLTARGMAISSAAQSGSTANPNFFSPGEARALLLTPIRQASHG